MIEKRKSMIQRAMATLQQNPKGEKHIEQKLLCNHRLGIFMIFFQILDFHSF